MTLPTSVEVVSVWSSQHGRMYAHLPGSERFASSQLLTLDHYNKIFRELPPNKTLVDWGCGGGANIHAMVSAGLANRVYAVDICQYTLDAAARAAPIPIIPILIDPFKPRAAVSKINGKAGMFLCTDVLQHIPSIDHGAELVRIAYDVLAPGGHAMFSARIVGTQTRSDSYTNGFLRWTVYDAGVMRDQASFAGFEFVCELPRENVRAIAYYHLRKPVDGHP